MFSFNLASMYKRCEHEYVTLNNIYGDAINEHYGNRRKCICNKCGKTVLDGKLDVGFKNPPLENRGKR